MYLGQPGKSSVGSFYEIWKDGRRHAEGSAKIVWIDLATGRPTPLPEAIAGPLRALATT
jgi:acyl-CoA thioesterase FadM